MPLQSTFNTFSKLGYSSANTATNSFQLFETLRQANTQSFGYSIDLSKDGNYLIVGAPESNGQLGRTFFFSTTALSKFVLVDTENNPNSFTSFGNIVCTSFDANSTTITTGILNAQINERLYIYDRSSNTFSFNSFFNGANQANSQYGWSQYINSDGNFIGITDPRNSIQTVYFYNKSGNTWSLHSNIIFANTVTGPENVLLNSDGSQCFISINTSNPNTNGEVRIYDRSNTTWTLSQTITASDSLANDRFGTSLAINTNDNLLIVSASQTSESNIANVGGVYLFEYSIGNSQWEQTNKLIPDTILANLRIGSSLQSIDISNSNIIVGSHTYPNNDSSVYVWKYDDANTIWQYLQEITYPYGNAQNFGTAISINDSGNILMVGQYSANSFAGNVYQYVFV